MILYQTNFLLFFIFIRKFLKHFYNSTVYINKTSILTKKIETRIFNSNSGHIRCISMLGFDVVVAHLSAHDDDNYDADIADDYDGILFYKKKIIHI